MTAKFASAKHSIAECDRCGFRFKLNQLKALTIKTKQVNILVCQECWEADHPQLQLGMYPVSDPQAVENPRPDQSYYEAGNNGAGGSRHIQWGWQPVGGAPEWTGIENLLLARGQVGTVTITSTAGPNYIAYPASLTGTTVAGTVALAYDQNFPVSGVAGTAAVGSVTMGTLASVTGVAAASELGTGLVGIGVPVTGVDTTSAVGTVTAGSASAPTTTAAVTGVTGTGQVGTVAFLGPLIFIFDTTL